MNVDVTINQEKNGIELRFDSKPCPEMLFLPHKNGFRWSKLRNIWWAKSNKRRVAFAEAIKNVSHET